MDRLGAVDFVPDVAADEISTSHATAMVNFVANLTAEAACEALRGAGMTCSPEDIQIIAREERWAVSLPGERIAWFPASELGNKRLAVERRVLRLLAERCSYQAPRILFVSACGFDVRQMVPGRCDPWGLFHRCKADSRLAQRIGRSIGAILAEQHAKIAEVDVAGWLPQRVAWPEPSHWMRERLPQVVNDHALIGVMEQVIERYDAVRVGVKDSALVHGDVGLHIWRSIWRPIRSTVFSITTALPGRTGTMISGICSLTWIAKTCWIPPLRFMSPPRVDRSVAIVSGSTMPRARSAIWHLE
jgi:hypothetical protein